MVNRDGYGRGGEEAGMARLAALDVPAQVFDTHASFMDGNVLAIQRRIMVDEGDLARARRVIAEAEEIARGDRDPLD